MYGNKKCMKCGKPATHKFTRIENGQVFDLYFCEDHAVESSPYMPKSEIPLSEILEGLLKENLKIIPSGPAVPADLTCEQCGLTFDNYKKNLILGCSRCYDSFHQYLIPYLRKFHGDTRHMGRKPGGGHEMPVPSERSVQEADVEPVKKKAEAPSSAPPAVQVVFNDPPSAIAQLTKEMNKAIAREDFVKAAHCRDQIRMIEADMKQKSEEE